MNIKQTRLISKVDAEVFAAEQRLTGAEAWVTYECGKGGQFVVTVRRRLSAFEATFPTHSA